MSRIQSAATFEETFTQQWPWGRYDDLSALAIAGGGSEAWTPAYAPTGGPSVPDVGALTLTATADATGDVVLEHVEGNPGTPTWLPDRQARAEWWARFPDVVPAGLAYVVAGEVRDAGTGELLEVLELYRDDAPAPGWSHVTIDWPARDDALYAAIYVQHRWTGYAAGAPQLLAGDVIGLAAGMLVEPSSWDRGYFDGDTPNDFDVAYFDMGSYAEARVTRNYTAEPELILDYAYSRNAPTIVHDILGRGDPDITVRPVGTREGTLNMFCLTREQALEVETVNRQAGSIYLDTFEEDPTASMNYVVTGLMTTTWYPETNRWVVAVPYREVPL